MENYVTLVRLLENGQQSARQSPSQIIKDVMSRNKGNVITAHATLGFYDFVIVSQFPDKESALKAFTTLKIDHQWITETLQAEPIEKYDTIYNEILKSTSSRRS